MRTASFKSNLLVMIKEKCTLRVYPILLSNLKSKSSTGLENSSYIRNKVLTHFQHPFLFLMTLNIHFGVHLHLALFFLMITNIKILNPCSVAKGRDLSQKLAFHHDGCIGGSTIESMTCNVCDPQC